MKIFVKILFTCFLLCVLSTTLSAKDHQNTEAKETKNELLENPTNITDLFTLLQALEHINQQIYDYKATHKDAKEEDSELQVVIAQKAKLLQHLPELLLGKQKQMLFDKKEADNQIHQLNLQIEVNKKQRRDLLVLRDELMAKGLELDTTMYDFFSSLNARIKDYPNTDSLENFIDTELFTLKSLNLADYQKAIQNLPADNIDTIQTLQTQLETLQNKIQTDIETLEYLRSRVNDFATNFFLTHMNIQNVIDAINEVTPYHNYINWGKVSLCLFILIFMASFGRLLAKISYIFVSKMVHQNDNEELKQQTIYALTRPITLLLIAIALEFSVDILYYPIPAPFVVGKWFGVCYIVLISWFLIALLRGYGTGLVTTIAQRHTEGFRKEVLNLCLKVVYFAIVIVAFLLILKQLGFDVSTLVASLGIGGLAVALAVKDMLANFFASVMLLFDNSFSQGDWIVCGDIDGIVVEIGLRRTTVRTFDNALLFVPNSKLANEYIKNWNRRQVGRRIRMVIGLTYDSPKEKLQQCVRDIREMLQNHPKISTEQNKEYTEQNYTLSFKKDIVSLDDFSGYKTTLLVYLDELSDSSINILVYCFSKTTVWKEWLEVKEDVIFKIMDIVEKNQLSFAFPTQSLHIEAIPTSLPKHV